MLNLKKTALAVLALSSSAVFAGTMGPVCAPGNVTVPCERSAWEFGAQALYLQPSYTTHSYIGSAYTYSTESEAYVNAAPNWGWGFKIEGAYYFQTGSDLNLNWYHYNHSTKSSFSLPHTQAFIDESGEYDYHVVGINQAVIRPHWDAVNLEFGQLVDFGDWKKIRFHGGVQYVRVNTTQNVSLPQTDPTKGIGNNTALNTNLTYNGFGPRVGADMAYHIGYGFGIYANSALGLVVGSSKFSDSTVGTGPSFSVSTYTGSATKIVPELEARLGGTYAYSMAQGDLSIDLGWMWINYWGIQDIAFGNGSTKETGFGLQGPYVGLKWLGSVA